MSLRKTLLGTTAALAVVVTGGCGNTPRPPTAAAVAAKLAADPAAKLSTLKPAQLTCVAGVLRTYVKPGQLNDYVAGKRTFASLEGSDEAKAQAGVVACVKP